MRFTAEFTPQAWFNDYAITVDPQGDTVWDVTRFLSMLKPEHRASCCVADTNESDLLKDDPNAPEWVRNWSGPFYVEVHVEAENDAERAELALDGEASSYVDRLPYIDPESDEAKAQREESVGSPTVVEPVAETTGGGCGAYVVLQEGGSSEEVYIHASDTREEAEAFRISCRDDGSYRTSDIIEIPAALAVHGEGLYEVLEQVARAQFDYPAGEAAEPADAEDEAA